MFSGPLQKDLFKGKWSLAKSWFKQNYRHACHVRVAVFFSLPSCCVSSLIATTPRGHAITEPRGGEKGLGYRKWSGKIPRKLSVSDLGAGKFVVPFRSSFILIINSLEWFSELEHLKNILEINDWHFGAKKVGILLEMLTYWQPYKHEGHEKIRSIRLSLSGL